MKWPGKDNINYNASSNYDVPPAGRYDVRLINTSTRAVTSGTWMVFDLEIVSGDHAGHTFQDEFYFPDGKEPAHAVAKLGKIFEASAWWPPLDDGEEVDPAAFAMLLPVGEEGLLFSVDCVQEHSVKAYLDVNSYRDFTQTSPEKTDACPHGPKWIRVEKAQWDGWPEELRFLKLKPRHAFGLELGMIYAPVGEVPEPAEAALVADDELPF